MKWMNNSDSLNIKTKQRVKWLASRTIREGEKTVNNDNNVKEKERRAPLGLSVTVVNDLWTCDCNLRKWEQQFRYAMTIEITDWHQIHVLHGGYRKINILVLYYITI